MAVPFPLFDDDGVSNSESEFTAFFLAAGFAGGVSNISTSESSTFVAAFFAGARFLGGGGTSSSLSVFLIVMPDPEGTAEAGFLASAAFFGFAAGFLGLKSSSESSFFGFLGAAKSLLCFFLPFLAVVSPSAAHSFASQSSQVCYERDSSTDVANGWILKNQLTFHCARKASKSVCQIWIGVSARRVSNSSSFSLACCLSLSI